MSLDALIYANLPNSIQSASDLTDLNKYFPTDGLYNFASGQTKMDNLKNLDNVLDQTQLKRACCLGTDKIDVRIPLFKDADISINIGNGALMNEYKYYDKTVKIPDKMCPNGYDRKNSPKDDPAVLKNCEAFYKIYCKNIINEFTKQNGNKWDLGKFLQYKPECACMVPPPAGIPVGINIAPKCLYDRCTEGRFESNEVWLDKESRKGKCDLTICQANINFADLNAQNNIGVQTQIEQKCGQNNQSTTPPPNAKAPPPDTKAPPPDTKAPTPDTKTPTDDTLKIPSTFMSLFGDKKWTFIIIFGIICCMILMSIMAAILFNSKNPNV